MIATIQGLVAILRFLTAPRCGYRKLFVNVVAGQRRMRKSTRRVSPLSWKGPRDVTARTAGEDEWEPYTIALPS
jgi:hypothetical protein